MSFPRCDSGGGRVSAVVIAIGALLAAGLCLAITASSAAAQTASVAQEPVPLWAFPLTSRSTSPAPPASQDYTLPGSTRRFTHSQLLDRTTAVDWFPTDHPPMPAAVRGRPGRGAACGFCHLPEGQGRPENASLAGLPYTYLLQQISDMKSGARKLVNPNFTPGALMLQAVSQIGDADAEQVAHYFSALTYTKRVKV